MISAIIFKSIKQTGVIRDLSKVPNTSFESFDGKIETSIAYIRRDNYISEPD